MNSVGALCTEQKCQCASAWALMRWSSQAVTFQRKLARQLHLAAIRASNKVQINGFVHQRLSCQGKTVLLPVHSVVYLRPQDLLHKILHDWKERSSWLGYARALPRQGHPSFTGSMRAILGRITCGFVPCTLLASGSVLLAILKQNLQIIWIMYAVARPCTTFYCQAISTSFAIAAIGPRLCRPLQASMSVPVSLISAMQEQPVAINRMEWNIQLPAGGAQLPDKECLDELAPAPRGGSQYPS